MTRRRLVWMLLAPVVLLAAGEILARTVTGLGDPPLTVAHPRVEYLFAPNQDVRRFGNQVRINEWGMRSRSFPSEKRAPGEFRVMAFGDSVLNGGALTDHSDLATTRLRETLAASSDAPVEVGNISAGSWGPQNWLGYAETYGFFDTDVVVLLVSSHDAGDAATFAPLSANTHPMDKPFAALAEGARRYLPRYVPALDFIAYAERELPVEPDPEIVRLTPMAALGQFLELAAASAPRLLVALFPSRVEAGSGRPETGFHEVKRLLEARQIEHVSLHSQFQDALANGRDPYRENDTIHPNPAGQAIIHRVLLEALQARGWAGPGDAASGRG